MTTNNNKSNKKTNGVWFIDMDGTIAEWLIDAGDRLNDAGYFRELPVTSFLAPLRAFAAAGGEVYILSHYMPNGKALPDKHGWLDEHFPEVPRSRRLFVPCGESKVDFVKECFGITKLNDSMVLFDDYSTNLHGWKAAGGRGIKCFNGINGNHGTWTGEGFMWSRELAEALDVVGSEKKQKKTAIRKKCGVAGAAAATA